MTIRMALILGLFLFLVPMAQAKDSAPSAEVLVQVQNFLTEERMDKVQIRTIGGLLVLRGEVEIPNQMEKIEKLITGLRQADPSVAVQSFVQVSPVAWNLIAERVEREIGSPEITARIVNRSLILEGTAENDFEADRSVVIAKALLAINMDKTRTVAAASNEFTIVDMLRVRAPAKGPKKPAKSSTVGMASPPRSLSTR